MKEKIRFGPAGMGGVKEAISNLNSFSKKGIKACEIAFTYGVYIKNKKDAEKINNESKNLDIKLSIHAPYYINLNSKDKKKIIASKKRILECCKIGHYLGAESIIFHPGYYSNLNKEEAFQNIKTEILNLQKEIKKNKWKVKLCPETTGKKNVFGSIEEISRLVKTTKCGFCIDFAHILAREKDYCFDKLKKYFSQKKWHCHFSGIVFSEKGERHHKLTDEREWRKILNFLKKENKKAVIINESPLPIRDSIKGIKILSKL